MITSVEGTLAGTGLDWVDVDVGAVTLRVSVPGSSVEGLGQHGDRVRLLTTLQVKEDSLTLFGFPTEESRSVFEALISVSGVGPRGALSVLSTLTPEALALAVDTADPDAFKGVHGVGAKTAGRIVLELTGKLKVDRMPATQVVGGGDLVDALTALGIGVSEALEAASSLPSGNSMSLEEKVRFCLQRLGAR